MPNPWLAYETLRSIHFGSQYVALTALSRLLPGQAPPPERDPELIRRILGHMGELLAEDAQRFQKGDFPTRMLLPEAPLQYLRRTPRVIADSFLVSRRRARGKTTEFKASARELLENVPRYYRRNFHFQTDGYLSADSAAVYDHQVELLFLGSAGAMRRLLLRPLIARFGRGGKGRGKGLSILEIGCGTGSTTRYLRMLYPEARITAVDLSAPYLREAQRRLEKLPGRLVTFEESAGESLPYKDGEFDAVVNVFLFHELPRAVRVQMLREARRVLKPRGLYAMVDSMQLGDVPELDLMLDQFPTLFHEPFYRDYVRTPLVPLIKAAGFKSVRSERGFYSKVAWGTR